MVHLIVTKAVVTLDKFPHIWLLWDVVSCKYICVRFYQKHYNFCFFLFFGLVTFIFEPFFRVINIFGRIIINNFIRYFVVVVFLMLFLLTGCLLKNSHTLTEIIEMNVCGNVCRDDIFIYSNDDDRKLVRFTFHSVIETLNSIKHIHKYTHTYTLSNTDRRLKWQNTWIALDKIKKK